MFKKFKKTPPKPSFIKYEIWMVDKLNHFPDAPKDREFTLIMVCLSPSIGLIALEKELTDQYNDRWYYNQMADDYRILGDRNVVACIRRSR